ncbi:cupin domain-containing protein [Virgisporangium aurantiacum]|uniref:JmjC domain-containing protein n=1 Tax=Virgisporangium aurantiacum TaxID=175570 RepID=A0A8J3ZLU3_9ACTN|nr:cupin domain-containing protein [Virgisporangium aurantiacum]GIJ63876.1 hypothetical protein Vau01_113920 [Virgisporangium aurantiacum]
MSDHSSSCAFSLDWLLAPVQPGAFFERFWETAPVLIDRDAPSYFADLPGLDSVDELIATTVSNRRRPAGGERLVRSAPDGALSERSVPVGINAMPDVQSVYRAYHHGYTVVINQMQHRSAVVGRLCRALRATLHHPVGANLYLTPAGAQGFLPHVDTHDVFIVQIHGTKEWHVAEPSVRLPLAQRRYDRTVLAAAQTYTLAPGDTFYLPRGFPHEAVTGKTSSMHLTIGIHAFRWTDLLAEILDLWADDEVALRSALPPRFLDQSLDSARVVALAHGLAAALDEGSLVERAKSRIGSKLIAGGAPMENGRFRALDALDTLTQDSIVTRSPEVLCQVRETEDSAMLEFDGNFITGPPSITSALEYVACHERFAVGEVPGELSPQDRIDLVVRLVSEGLLEVTFE